MDAIELLKEKNYHALFRQARELAQAKPTITISGSFLDTRCDSDPYCRHCIWRTREKFTTDFRRRVTREEFVARGISARAEGIDWLYPVSGCTGADLPEHFYECLRALKQVSDIKLYGLFTALNKKSLEQLKQAGVEGYRCAIESPNRRIFQEVRPHDNYDARIQSIKDAKKLGLKVWSGFIIGLGEDSEDVARGIGILKDLEVDAVMLNAFMPAPFTDMEALNSPRPMDVAKAMAVTRIMMPEIDLIFSHNNEFWGLTAGCNGGLIAGNSRMISELGKMREAIYAYQE
jgi:biotin synthase